MFNRVEFMIENPTDTYEPVACPAPLLPFPAGIDEGGGFVCFDPEAEGGTLRVLAGSNQFMELKAQPGHQLADGTVIDPPASRGWQVDMPTQ